MLLFSTSSLLYQDSLLIRIPPLDPRGGTSGEQARSLQVVAHAQEVVIVGHEVLRPVEVERLRGGSVSRLLLPEVKWLAALDGLASLEGSYAADEGILLVGISVEEVT